MANYQRDVASRLPGVGLHLAARLEKIDTAPYFGTVTQRSARSFAPGAS